MKRLSNFLHHLFIPKEENNFRAKALHTDFLTYYFVFAFLLTIVFKNLNNKYKDILGFATDITIEKLYQLTNLEREKNNLPLLTHNTQLAQAAREKAGDMFKKNYWAHYSPDGTTPWDFILNSNYHYEYAGENLAKNFLFSQGVIDAWMASSTHKDNILKKDYTDVGFAVVNGVLNGEETTLVVQIFGKPLTSTLTQKINHQAIKSPKTAILAKKASYNKVSLPHLSLDLYLVFILFLTLALTLDLYFAYRFNITRISGKNIAHLIFIIFIILGLIFLTKGSII